MAKIELVSWDVYGTLLDTRYGMESTDNPETEKCRFRQGALDTLIKIKSKGIFQNTISDRNIDNLKTNLGEAGISWKDYFFHRYPMTPNQQKDIINMLDFYKEAFRFSFKPKNILVIGDNYDIDIALAKQQGCQTIYTPELKNQENSLPVEEIMKLL